MEKGAIAFALLNVLLNFKMTKCALWAQTRDEYIKLHSAYSHTANTQYFSDIIPRSDNSVPIDVTIGMDMYSMSEFDAVNGALEIVGSVSLAWVDAIESLSATTTFDSTSVDSILVNYRKIWTPNIVLLNSAESVQRIGDETYLVRFNLSSDVATWKPRVLMKASCTPNVKYFPFDQQKCEFVFMPWYQDSTMVRLIAASGEWELGNFKKNALWKVKSTSSEVILSNGYYFATFGIKFQRQPMFFTINVMLPVLLLSMLSGFLFLLPAASGERVGFGITCFLSFVVLLQTMVQYLPEISDPMSLLCFYAIIMMIFSGALSIINILLMKVYLHTETDSLPKFLVHFLEVIKCIKCKRATNSKTDNDNPKAENGNDVEALSTVSDSNGSETSEDVMEMDWTAVGKTLDGFFIIIFVGAQIGFTLVFVAPIVTNAG